MISNQPSPITPEVSVIILTRNHQTTLWRAVDSVIGQKFSKPFEIILSDDDSSDNSRALCEELATLYPEKIRLMPRTKRKGVVDNYFDSLKQCRGTYVTDCSGDDYWAADDTLSRLYDAISVDSHIALAFGNWMCVNPEGLTVCPSATGYTKALQIMSADGCIEPNAYIAKGKLLLQAVLSCPTSPLIHLSAAIYRRSALTTLLSLNPEVIKIDKYGIEDLPIIAALLNAGDAAILTDPQPLIAYSIGHDSITSPVDNRAAARYYLNSASLLRLLADNYLDDNTRKSASYRHTLSEKLCFALLKAIQVKSPELSKEIKTQIKQSGLPVSVSWRIRLLYARLKSQLQNK